MARIVKAHLKHLQLPFSLPRDSFVVTNGHFYFLGGSVAADMEVKQLLMVLKYCLVENIQLFSSL